MKFQNARELPEGKEGEQDLAALFITLGFDVKIHENLTAEEMVQKAKSHGQKQHRGAFFLIILSHGKVVDHQEADVGTDCKPVTIHELQTFFSAIACPSLCGVPKIFLIDAHQDSQQLQASIELTGSATTEFMIVHASIQRNEVSTDQDQDQDQDATCTLAQAFVEATNEADPSTPFTEIIERVKATVQGSNPDQVVKTVDTLTCNYFIKRYLYLFTPSISSLFREGSMPSTEELSSKLNTALQQWTLIREDTIQQIQNTIENLKFHHRNIGFTTPIFGSGSLWSIVMFLAGGVTTAGASIADVIQKSNVQQAQQHLTCDYEQLYVISALAIAIRSRINESDDHERQQCQGISTTELLVELALALTQGVFRTGNLGIQVAEVFATTFAAIKAGGAVPTRVAISESLGQLLGSLGGGLLGSWITEALGGTIGGLLGKTIGKSEAGGIAAARAGSKLVKGLAKAEIALNLITIPFDIYEIVQSSSSLANGSETDAVKELSQIVEQLEEEKEAIARIQEEQEQVINEPTQE